MSLYDDVMNAKPLFSSAQEALVHYVKEYEALGRKHGMTGNEFWNEANILHITMKTIETIMSLRMSINMCVNMVKEGL